MKKLFGIIYFFILFITPSLSKIDVKETISSTGLLADRDDQTLLVSTLDGTLHSVSKTTGEKKWTLKDSPIIQNPGHSEQPAIPKFFPNPQDGSLYRYTFGRGGKDPLKKLPFTIPELVANSPCRSNDGLFYIGKKTDSWVGVDIFTGKRQFVLGMDTADKVCPKPSRNTVYIGRTLYNIMFYELHSGNKWNVSFYDYSRSSDSNFHHDQNYFVATGEGSMLTFDLESGKPLWALNLGSPVVAIFVLAEDKSLVSVPVTAVTPETLQKFTDQMKNSANMELPPLERSLIKEFRFTTYVGEGENGVYAVPALIDGTTPRISQRENHLLLDGPKGQRGVIANSPKDSLENDEETEFLILGYYDTIDSTDIHMDSFGKPTRENFVKDLPLMITYKENVTLESHEQKDAKEDLLSRGLEQVRELNASFIFSKDFVAFSRIVVKTSYHWIFETALNTLVTFVLTMLMFLIVLITLNFQNQARFMNEISSRKLTSSSKGSNSGHGGGEITAIAEELDSGDIKVGKIIFNPTQLLGKGCDGTFVFKGRFDDRPIAVKRVLPSCFTIADREVDLLRVSDQHPNIVRYFCMEQCREFRYIALELCAATLEDFITGQFECDVSPLILLQEATSGLNHLHSLDIVHRDIKPHNVLISTESPKRPVRAMISDFGLCKMLESGRTSFSKRSGITGTNGWIAPEMLSNSTHRPTTKVDIFSLGCVFYYVLTKGKHPFGFLLDRQSNILNDKANLSHLYDEKDFLAKSLIEIMVKHKPRDRPPTSAVLLYPLFWSADKSLQFFQDVSDRIEKEGPNSFILRKLESGAAEVVRDNWTNHIDSSVGEDLKRFRDYNGRSVKDLLRALRNKKNHYRELPENARRVFGHTPDDFLAYWTNLFPRLLMHSWFALQNCKSEPIFAKYYFKGYNFEQKEDLIEQCPDEDPYRTIHLCPNNRRPGEIVEQQSRMLKKKPSSKKKPLDDIFDLRLGSPIQKGPSKSTKHEGNKPRSPTWVLRKSVTAVEPKFVTQSPLRRLEVEDDNEEVNRNE